MTRRMWVAGGVAAVIVIAAVIGRAQMSRMRAQFEGRKPELDVMRQRPSDLGLQYESFQTTNPEGTRIAGWWLPSETADGTVMMVHGFGQNKSSMLQRASAIVEAKFNVALIDLRARGESGGDRFDIGPAAASDVLAAVDAIRDRGWHDGLPLVAYGLSHGARAVLFAAAQPPGPFTAIVAEAPPFSLREGLRRQTGLPWVPTLPEGDLPGTFAALRDRPILLLLGDQDPEISEAQARSLLSGNAHGASGIHVFQNTGHGVFHDRTRDEYRTAVATFLTEIRPSRVAQGGYGTVGN